MKYAVTVFLCAVLLPLEWLLFVGTLKLLSGPFGFYRGTPDDVAKRAITRKKLTIAWVGFF